MLTPLPPIGSRSGSLGSQAQQLSSFPKQTNVSNNIGFASQHHKASSFEVFNAILQKAYRHMAFNPTNDSSYSAQSTRPFDSANLPILTNNDLAKHDLAKYDIANYERVDKISSQQAADTILDFITQRIKLDKANGASQDELLERLDQGLKGFVKGFNEAKDQIEGLGLLTPVSICLL